MEGMESGGVGEGDFILLFIFFRNAIIQNCH